MNKIFFVILITLCYSAYSQKSKLDSVYFQNEAKEINLLISEMKNNKLDSQKLDVSHKIQAKLDSVLQKENSFFYPFKELGKIKIITASNNLRIFTFSVSLENNAKFKHFGIVQYYSSKKKNIFILDDNSDCKKDSSERASFSDSLWYGAIYYEAISIKKNIFVLFGFDACNDTKNRKIIEILNIENNKIIFGDNLFENRNKRVIFEYSKNTNFTLNYDKKLKMIVFEHLIPSNPLYKNIYDYYVPDMAFDGYIFKKSKFVKISNIKMKNNLKHD